MIMVENLLRHNDSANSPLQLLRKVGFPGIYVLLSTSAVAL